MGAFHSTLFLLLARLLVLPMLFIAVNSPNLAHQHWEGKKTAKRRSAEVQAWMVTNRLKINDTKMEFPFVGSPSTVDIKEQLESVTVEDSEIRVRNLGAWFDGHSCEQSAVRPSSIYISSDRSESIYRKMLPCPGSCLCNISSCLLQLSALWFSKYQRDRLQRILSTCIYLHCLLGTQVQSPHTSLYNLHCLPVP